jgi:hypothetical protein
LLERSGQKHRYVLQIMVLPKLTELYSFLIVRITHDAHKIDVNPSTSVLDLKRRLRLPGSAMPETDDHMLVVRHLGRELGNDQLLETAGVRQTTSLHIVMRRPDLVLPDELQARLVNSKVLSISQGAMEGIASGARPTLLEDCTGGTYLLRNSEGKKVGIFKPVDEEPYAPLNPKGNLGEMHVMSLMRSGVPVGHAAMREVAAYLLDKDDRVGVPHTTMLRVLQTDVHSGRAELELKYGSFQEYREHIGCAEDISVSKLTARQIHLLGVFDLRILNTDRHTGNILVAKVEPPAASDAPFELIPIDHGFAFPSWRHIGDVNQEWAHWPQARQPFDEDTRAYIESLDAISDMAMLNVSLTLGSESNIDFLRAVAVGTVLVQCAARNGLTLHEIAMMLVREDSRPSAVERVLQTLARDIDAADDESAVLAGASTGVVPDGNCLQLIVRAERSDLSPHTKGKGGGGSWSESTFDIEVEQRFISIFYERLEAEIHRRARSSMQHGPSGLSSSRSGS